MPTAFAMRLGVESVHRARTYLRFGTPLFHGEDSIGGDKSRD
jgi:hypothetical protein